MGSYYATPPPFNPLTREEEAILFKQVRAGSPEAKATLVERYLLFAASEGRRAARIYHYRCFEMEDEDIVYFANIGLMAAVDRFDATRGFLFSTFARTTIRGMVRHAIKREAKRRTVLVSLEALTFVGGDWGGLHRSTEFIWEPQEKSLPDELVEHPFDVWLEEHTRKERVTQILALPWCSHDRKWVKALFRGDRQGAARQMRVSRQAVEQQSRRLVAKARTMLKEKEALTLACNLVSCHA